MSNTRQSTMTNSTPTGPKRNSRKSLRPGKGQRRRSMTKHGTMNSSRNATTRCEVKGKSSIHLPTSPTRMQRQVRGTVHARTQPQREATRVVEANAFGSACQTFSVGENILKVKQRRWSTMSSRNESQFFSSPLSAHTSSSFGISRGDSWADKSKSSNNRVM